MNLGIGLGITNYQGVPTVPLDPDQVIADLFDAGGGTFYEGAWYDPSDLTTLYQDAAGTTPVTGTGQPVGLMLDKSKGLTLGSELVTNGTFDTAADWTLGTGWSIGSGIATKSPGTGSNLQQTYSFVVGKWYKLTFDVLRRDNGAMQIQIGGGTALSVTGFVSWSTGTHSVYFTPNSGNNLLRFIAGSTFDADIDNVSLKELPGNHATQSTSTARPTLQVTGTTPATLGSELVTNGTFDANVSGWTVAGSATVTWDSDDGGAALVDITGPGGGIVDDQVIPVTAGKTYKVTARIRAGTYTNVLVWSMAGSTITFTPSASYTEITRYITASSSDLSFAITRGAGLTGSFYVSNITVKEVLTWADPKYYLDFDGVDDRMVASFASVVNRPADIAIAWNRDVTASGYIYNGATSNGRLFLSTLNNPPRAIQIGNYDATTGAAGNWEDSATSGVVDAVVTARFTTTSPYRALRINGSAASVIFNAGASGGNSWDGITLGSSYTFGAYSNVNIYGYVGVNRNLTAGEIDDVEAYLAAKSGVTL